MNKYYVYILESENTKCYYVGSTSNLERRIQEHNAKKVKSTKSKTPWKLKYYELFDNLSKTRSRENQIKKWKKRLAIEKLILTHSSSDSGRISQ